jgi:hypothetical protein
MSEGNPAVLESQSEAPEAERRAWVRYMSDLEVNCRRIEDRDDKDWPGRAVNISVAGIGLLLRRRFPSGTLLRVELKAGSGGGGRTVEARVVHATSIKDEENSSWLLGCAFLRELAEEEVWALVRDD